MASSGFLTSGDLAGLDAGQLREHLVAHTARFGWSSYTVRVAETISMLTDFEVDEVKADVLAEIDGAA
jgi:hypothetical protein